MSRNTRFLATAILFPGKTKHLSLFPTPESPSKERSEYHVPVGTGTDLSKKRAYPKLL